MKREIRLYVQDILECIDKIEEFIADMDFREFASDDKTSSAVVRKLEIIGEATKNIPQHLMDQYEDIPWSDMARMRDKIIHFYFGVDYEVVWKVIKESLPELKPKIERILIEIEKGQTTDD